MPKQILPPPSKKIFNLPNFLSLARILLAPLFVICYFSTRIQNSMGWAIVILVLSGLTDVADGIIARHFNMITELGQVLDPIADKLTQACIVVSLAVNHSQFVFLFILLVAKELSMLLGLVRLMKEKKKPPAAKWWGKMSTVVLFCVTGIALLLDVFGILKDFDFIITTLVVIAGICMVFSLFNYYPIFKELESGESKEETEETKSNG
ncbi:MAG: CDP-alcohol phosphatidyltransferase family protein [Oscillospiraceae bacterium]|jgi:cardiolipin synthase|nr:CDP-alcohol phosphatidyltransferase family protein [Oscillospiraceae bacterium]